MFEVERKTILQGYAVQYDRLNFWINNGLKVKLRFEISDLLDKQLATIQSEPSYQNVTTQIKLLFIPVQLQTLASIETAFITVDNMLLQVGSNLKQSNPVSYHQLVEIEARNASNVTTFNLPDWLKPQAPAAKEIWDLSQYEVDYLNNQLKLEKILKVFQAFRLNLKEYQEVQKVRLVRRQLAKIRNGKV